MSVRKIVKPNFLIVGAAKSGTSSLWYYLRQHPDVYMPQLKEPRFLASANLIENNEDVIYKYQLICKCRHIVSINEYFEMFKYAHDCKAIGEASTHYLFTYKTTIPVIKRYIGNPKIIIILRNPMDRAYSMYRYTLGRTDSPYFFNETRPFEECLKQEEKTIKEETLTFMHFYKTSSLYYDQVKSYMDNFSEVKVLLFDDLENNPGLLMEDLFDFLEIDQGFLPFMGKRHNVNVPDNNIFERVLFSQNLRRSIAPVLFKLFGEKRSMHIYNYILDQFMKRNEMNPETRKYLAEYFREDVLKLQNLISIDLSDWLDQ